MFTSMQNKPHLCPALRAVGTPAAIASVVMWFAFSDLRRFGDDHAS